MSTPTPEEWLVSQWRTRDPEAFQAFAARSAEWTPKELHQYLCSVSGRDLIRMETPLSDLITVGFASLDYGILLRLIQQQPTTHQEKSHAAKAH